MPQWLDPEANIGEIGRQIQASVRAREVVRPMAQVNPIDEPAPRRRGAAP